MRSPLENGSLELQIYDIECYPNYFLAKFLNSDGSIVSYDHNRLPALRAHVRNKNLVLIGFNNVWYDDLLLKYIIYTHVSVLDIFKKGDWIIKLPKGDKHQKFWNLENLAPTWFRSIDVMQIPKIQGSLKERGCALGVDVICDLPIRPGTFLNPKQKVEIFKYCDYDLFTTKVVYEDSFDHLVNRVELEKIYCGTDLISKSDAALSETIMKFEYCKRNNIAVSALKSRILKQGEHLDLASTIPPQAVNFKNEVFHKLVNSVFKTTGVFSTKAEKKTLSRSVEFAGSSYNFGAGGLHSCDKVLVLNENAECFIVDIDVDSFYMALISNLEIRPPHMNRIFNDILEEQTRLRLEAKYAGNVKKATSLKPVILSNFGKTGSPFSVMFGELTFLQVTIAGQFLLLLLVEIMTECGFIVQSANTDGLVFTVKKNEYGKFKKTYNTWCSLTDLKLSETYYSKYIRRDVNNYICCDSKGNVVKAKGVFKTRIKGKADIISEAVREYISKKTPVEKTIKQCRDIKKFIFYFQPNKEYTMKKHAFKFLSRGEIKQLASERVPDNPSEVIQRTNRWYKSTTSETIITKSKTMSEKEQQRWRSTHKNMPNHPNSWIKSERLEDGIHIRIVNILPRWFPKDIDYEYYINKADKILESVNHV